MNLNGWKNSYLRGHVILLSLFLITMLACCGGGGSAGDNDEDTNNVSPVTQALAAEAIQEIAGEETQKTIDLYPVPFTVRAASDALIPALSDLSELGLEATDVILDEFRRPPTLYDDVRITVLAYALEQIGDERAAPVLADWLEEYMFVHSVGWPTDFVTHTIKVLTEQENLNTHSYTYLIDEIFDTIQQVPRGDQHAGNQAAMQSDTIRNTLSSKPPSNTCAKTIQISGIDSNENPKSIEIKYTVVKKDLYQLSEDPSYSDVQRAKMKERIESWKEADERYYGGTTYKPAVDATYTNSSNCGGSVTERIANKLFSKLNIPMTLTKGRSSPDFIAEVARTFGDKVDLEEIDTWTVISFEENGRSGHVEIPMVVGEDTASIFSKDDMGKERSHEVDLKASSVQEQFKPPFDRLKETSLPSVEVVFYRIDPSRITSILVDNSSCTSIDWSYYNRVIAYLTISAVIGDGKGGLLPDSDLQLGSGSLGSIDTNQEPHSLSYTIDHEIPESMIFFEGVIYGTILPDADKIPSLTCSYLKTDTVIGFDNTTSADFTVTDVPLEKTVGDAYWYRVTGLDVCDHVSLLLYSHTSEYSGLTRNLESYTCNEESELWIQVTHKNL